MEIDHIYSRVLDNSDYETMKELGFKCNDKRIVEHPHKLLCSFVYLRNWQYLEFVHITDIDVYRDECREDIELYGVEQYCGISLRSVESLKEYYNKNLDLFAPLKPCYEHRNYFWKENSKDYLPGWNFLRFKELAMPKTCVWFTEYEDTEDYTRPEKPPEIIHPNSVHSLCGLVLESSDKFSFKDELGKEVMLYDDEQEDFVDKKSFVKAVILQTDSFDTFLSVSKKEPNYTFKGSPAYRFKRDQYCFDILII